MGDSKGFLKIKRKDGGYRPVAERIFDYGEVEQTLNEDDRKLQASRCMDCGVPFCHWACPIDNVIPEWQDYLYKGEYKKAIDYLHMTNNFPEFTGRICPALCEKSCVLSINDDAVTIRENEVAIVEKAFQEGLIIPQPPKVRTGKTVAVIGSGPAGLACADLLNKAGHTVTLFEKDDKVGGLLRYGIPDFKLSKNVIDRRVDILLQEGLIVKTGVNVGVDITAADLLKKFDAVCISIGAMQPRDLIVEGRELKGIYFAMEFLKQQNMIVAGIDIPDNERISAKDKDVLVIGGGDTGSDCVGTSIRHGAKSVTQIEIMPIPPLDRPKENPWPYWPKTMKTSSSHEEGCTRRWALATKKFIGVNGNVEEVEVEQVQWYNDANGKLAFKYVEGSTEKITASLVLLAMGFTQPVHKNLCDDLGVAYDERGNIKVDNKFCTSVPKVFSAGDAQNGASLVVTAIDKGRRAAKAINDFLME